MEQSLRHLIIVGYMSLVGTQRAAPDEIQASLYQIRWPGWEIIEGEFFNFFVFNLGSGALTSGTLVDGFIVMRGDWIDK